MDANKYPVAHPQVAARIVDGSAVIVLADSGTVTVLNEVGTSVWELIDGTRSIGAIVQAIESEYEVSLEEAARDVQELIQQLLDAKAILLKDSA
jgi:coenzyme PQQ synthesis protein D (PqqD)